MFRTHAAIAAVPAEASLPRPSAESAMEASAQDVRATMLIERMESVPFSKWHARARIVMGSATFFDAYAALSLAYALPVLIGLWHLRGAQIGYLIGVGYIGQLLGAIFFGALAERVGRIRSATAAISVMSVMGIACIFANSFAALLVCRFIQGIGVGGEVPVAATYLNELSQARGRGRFFLLGQLIFPIGLMITGLIGAWLVPFLGWRAMFLFGAVPTLISAVFVALLPESPRWLIFQGRLDEAQRVIEQAEDSAARLPPEKRVPSTEPHVPVTMANCKTCFVNHSKGKRRIWSELFSVVYRRRTFVVWTMWITSYFIANGLNNWLPSLYKTVYHMDLQSALHFASLTNVLQVVITVACALLIDRVGRRYWNIGAFVLTAAALAGVWLLGAHEALPVIVFGSLGYGIIGSTNTLLFLYTTEIYPTRMRAIATAIATSWLRGASAVAPAVVGLIVDANGIDGMFLLFAVIGVVGAFAAWQMIETSERQLEEIAP